MRARRGPLQGPRCGIGMRARHGRSVNEGDRDAVGAIFIAVGRLARRMGVLPGTAVAQVVRGDDRHVGALAFFAGLVGVRVHHVTILLQIRQSELVRAWRGARTQPG